MGTLTIVMGKTKRNVLFFFVALLGVAIALPSTSLDLRLPFVTKSRLDNKTTAARSICQAIDSLSFTNCISQVNGDTADAIEIANVITCTGADACKGLLNQVNRPVLIYGRANSNAGFRRLDTYNYHILDVRKSSQVTIRNLTFDENKEQACDAINDIANCKSTVLAYNSTNTTIDQITTFYAKRAGFESVASDDTKVIDSKFIASHQFGIVFNGQNISSMTAFAENNLIKDSKANGVVIYHVSAPQERPLIFRNNILMNNHNQNLYELCGPSRTKPCSGGQLLIRASQNIKIEGNIIRDGRSVTNAETNATGGIEIDSYDIKNLCIINNFIHDNTMWGIYLNPNPVNVSDIIIAENTLYNNGTQIGYDAVNIGNFPAGVATIQKTCTQ